MLVIDDRVAHRLRYLFSLSSIQHDKGEGLHNVQTRQRADSIPSVTLMNDMRECQERDQASSSSSSQPTSLRELLWAQRILLVWVHILFAEPYHCILLVELLGYHHQRINHCSALWPPSHSGTALSESYHWNWKHCVVVAASSLVVSGRPYSRCPLQHHRPITRCEAVALLKWRWSA